MVTVRPIANLSEFSISGGGKREREKKNNVRIVPESTTKICQLFCGFEEEEEVHIYPCSLPMITTTMRQLQLKWERSGRLQGRPYFNLLLCTPAKIYSDWAAILHTTIGGRVFFFQRVWYFSFSLRSDSLPGGFPSFLFSLSLSLCFQCGIDKWPLHFLFFLGSLFSALVGVVAARSKHSPRFAIAAAGATVGRRCASLVPGRTPKVWCSVPQRWFDCVSSGEEKKMWLCLTGLFFGSFFTALYSGVLL